MNSSLMMVIDTFLFCYIVAGIVNPALWIQKTELKNDPNEQKKIRKIAIVLLVVEIAFCMVEYVF